MQIQNRYDVIIIGAGVSGSAAARELSRYQGTFCVLEKEEDVGCGTSKANSAIVHAGYDAEPGTLMAKLNVEGNAAMEKLAKELDFEFERNGSLVVCLAEEEREQLQALYERGVQNGVQNLRIIEREELKQMEPHIADHAVAALYAPTAGIVCPFHLNIAMAENAVQNGVAFHFNTKVKKIAKSAYGWKIETNQNVYETKCVVNAAGLYADQFHNMVSKEKITITPRKGEYCLLDKSAHSHVTKTIFQLPGKFGKGVLVAPTIHGNLIIGPTAEDIEDKQGTNTTQAGLQKVLEKAGQCVKDLPLKAVITSFAGLRAHEQHHEFIIQEVKDAPGFVDCAGIESPGLTSSPAIGKMVAHIVKDILSLKDNPSFIGTRKGPIQLSALSVQEKAAWIQKHPAYGNIICRCETISEGEIIAALHQPLPAKSLDGIKRRTRAGMGRCQSGFCSPRVMEILARERRIPMEKITKCGGGSQIVIERK